MFDIASSLDELDARGVCEFVAEQRTAQMRAEANMAAAVGQWCELHACDGCCDGQLLNPHLPGSEQARVYGAEDNPEVLEFCVAELAVALRQHVNGTVDLVADVQDLRFRHPLLWARVQGLQVPLWKARKIVGRTRHLSRELAQLVDARTADVVAALAWGRFLKVLDAAVIAADPETAERLRRAAEQARFARLGRPDAEGTGLRTFTARIRVSEAVWFDAMCARVALMLKQLGDTDPLEVRRSKAFELLGHPVKTLKLFADYQQALDEGRIPDQARLDPWADYPPPDDPGHNDQCDDEPTSPEPAGREPAGLEPAGLEPAGLEPAGLEPAGLEPAGPEGTRGVDELDLFGPRDPAEDDEEPVTEADVHPADNDADPEDADVMCPACAGAGSLDPRVAGDPTPFVRLATGLDLLDWGKLLPRVSFYVHGCAADFRDPCPDGSGDVGAGGAATGAAPAGSGVVRVEGHGALTVSQAREFFGHDTHHIVVKPVIDPVNVKPVDAYETPDAMAEVVHLLSPGDIFPYASYVGREVDLDHLWRYLDPGSGGPPGQTRVDNLGPLVRFHHRIKTHGRWRVRVVRPRVCIWRTPQGFYFQTDPRGTHPLTDEAGQLLWDACADHPETTGTGKVRATDIDQIAADTAVVPPEAMPPATAPSDPNPRRARPTPSRAGPSPMELELFTTIERHEYELSPN